MVENLRWTKGSSLLYYCMGPFASMYTTAFLLGKAETKAETKVHRKICCQRGLLVHLELERQLFLLGLLLNFQGLDAAEP